MGESLDLDRFTMDRCGGLVCVCIRRLRVRFQDH
jgi:hypothetical protein